MSLEIIIKASIKEKDFDGIVLTSSRGSRVIWWQKGKSEVYKLWTTFKVSKRTAFSCVEGKLSIF